MIKSLLLGCLVFYLSALCNGERFSTSSGETIVNMIMGDSKLLVSTSRAVYQLDLVLNQQQQKDLLSSSRLLVADSPTGTLNGTVFVCDDDFCYLLNVNNFTDVKWQVDRINVLLSGGGVAQGSFSLGPNSTSDITYGEPTNGNSGRRFAKGAFRNVKPASNPSEFFRYAETTSSNTNERVDFIRDTFTYAGFTYFTTQPNENEIRVVRFCQKDPGFSVSKVFRARYEILLQCQTRQRPILFSSAAFQNTNEGPKIFVSVTYMDQADTMTNEVCSFNVDTINNMMLEKLRTCANDMGQLGFGSQKQDCALGFPDNIREMQINEPCELRSSLIAGLEVDDAFVQQPVIQYTSGMEEFRSVVVSSLDGSLFLFAGTSIGEIKQFHLASSISPAPFVRTLVIGATPVIKMISSDNGEYLYSVRETEVTRQTIDKCSSYRDCLSCSSSPDPVCGWCVLRGSCTRQSQCAPVTDPTNVPRDPWFENSESCPIITAVQPEVLYHEDLTEILNASTPSITITTSNLETNPSIRAFDIKCLFRFNGAADVTRVATRAGESFTCPGPVLSQVPGFASGQVSMVFEVGLAINQIDVVSFSQLEILKCSAHNSCTACRGSGVNRCRWCVMSHDCVPDHASCRLSDEMTVGYDDQCNQIEPGQYLIHVDHTYLQPPLRIATSDLGLFREQFDRGEFYCELCEGDNCRFTNPARLTASGLEVECLRTQYTMELSEPRVPMDIRLIDDQQRQIDNPENAQVILYDCSLLGASCGQCLAITDNYTCSYCGGSCDLTARCTEQSFSGAENYGICPQPTITEISPASGPIEGATILSISGTNLGATRDQISEVRIGAAQCEVTGYVPGITVMCQTSGVAGQSSGEVTITIDIDGGTRTASSEELRFSYLMPELSIPEMLISPRSGGSEITITGPNINIGSSHRVTIDGQPCVNVIVSADSNTITCTTPAGNVGLSTVTVHVDNWVQSVPDALEYLPDPTFESISPRTSFASGGTNYTVVGTNLHTASKPRLVLYVTPASTKRQIVQQNTQAIESEPCTPEGTTILHCPAPAVMLDGSSSQDVSLGLIIGNSEGVRNLNEVLEVLNDPNFNTFPDQVFQQGQPVILEITGTDFRFTVDQISVRISPCNNMLGYCECSVHNITDTSLMCTVANSNALSMGNPLTVMAHLGFQNATVGLISIPPGIDLLLILIPIVAAVLVISGAIFIALVAVFCRKSRQKDQKYEQLILELERLESSVARECKLGFAELQTDLDDITDIAGSRLPYRNMITYLLSTLFPGARDHPVLHSLQIPSHRVPQVHRALEDFNDLIHDKKVLLLLIRTLEAERTFNIRDKSVVGSLLVVALINRFDYATDILKSLLSDLIHKTVSKSSPKLLLRRTETVAERMLTNWLAFCLHGYITEHVGQPLYLTYRAVKTQLEKGPIDVITGEARYSLSEQKLIRQKVDVAVLDVFVDAEDGHRLPVKLLDCDTISQVKEKLLDATYKTTPISSRPALKSIDLVFVQSPRDQMILRDEDVTMQRDGPWKKINTLQHYSIRSGALFRLVRRKEHPGPGKTYDYTGSLISSHAPRQRGLSEAEDGSRVWHLFKQLDTEDHKRSPFMNKKMVSEIYLPRMLSTKSILQKFVDDLFNSLFSMSHPPLSPTARYTTMLSPGVQIPMGYAPGADAVPLAIKYLFDFLDSEAESAKISDPDVVHMWKNNALSLRFWVNMIKNPEFVFDINKSHTVDACLSVIAQAFIDGCSFADTKLNMDSPTSKLLYNKEVQGYRARVKDYYHDVKMLPRVAEETMTQYLRQLSVYQAHATKNSGGFVVESALYELLRYCCKYSTEITGELRAAGLEAKAQSFDGIIKIFES